MRKRDRRMRGKVVFFQMPKTASQAVTKALAGECEVLTHSPDAATVASVRREFPDAFLFCFLRNPFDRVLSAYSYLARGHRDEVLRKARAMYVEPYRDFREFVLRGIGGGRALRQTHFKPQSSWIEEDGRPLVDWMGRYERLQEDFDAICGRMGWPGKSLKAVNGSVHGRWQDCYDAEMAAVVARRYGRDFELGGYGKVVE